MGDDQPPTLREIAGAQSPACGCCPNCKATHWITAAVRAQKQVEEMLTLHYRQQVENAALRRQIGELNAIIETRDLWGDFERRH